MVWAASSCFFFRPPQSHQNRLKPTPKGPALLPRRLHSLTQAATIGCIGISLGILLLLQKRTCVTDRTV